MKTSSEYKWINADTDSLFRAVLALENIGEVRDFMRDLLTEAEIKEFANRWKAAKLLARGVSYSEIAKQTWMSSTTIARIQKWLISGRGGYRRMILRLHHTNPAF